MVFALFLTKPTEFVLLTAARVNVNVSISALSKRLEIPMGESLINNIYFEKSQTNQINSSHKIQ